MMSSVAAEVLLSLGLSALMRSAAHLAASIRYGIGTVAYWCPEDCPHVSAQDSDSPDYSATAV